MKRALAVGLATLLVFGLAPAQKRRTLFGDAWTGQVVSTDDAARQITIKFEEKGKTETFAGVLAEGYAVKLKDGSSRELKVSEIPVGTRVRLFAKTRERKAAAGKVKFNSIFRVDFLGLDEFSRLREALNLEPSTPVSLDDSARLPGANPLKVHLVSEHAWSGDTFARWLSRWNKEHAAKYGSLEIAPGFAEADVSLVVLKGAEHLLITPFMIDADNRVNLFPPVTVFLASRKGDGLEVLWRQVLLTSPEAPPSDRSQITAEMEKRLKARSKK